MAPQTPYKATPSPDQLVIASINAKVTFQSQQLQELSDSYKKLEKLFVEGISEVRREIKEESKRNRNTTRFWSSLGLGMISIAIKWVMNKLGVDIME